MTEEETELVDEALRREFSFQQAQLVNVDLGGDFVGSEQGGRRPAVVLKEYSDSFIVAIVTSKMKRKLPTHVIYDAGDGGLLRKSNCSLEQIKRVSKKKVTCFHQYSPPEKIPMLQKAWNISVGLDVSNQRYVKS
ncbi:type II toxin-antitoxin system PemK/MazF family toxin (plasmid) [Pontibacillus sp. ALD_SL1]|nr:type II toxin-antitoxin system PemK/MazF family toxin [Pontibacillus sp. ALD_SL1]